MTDNGANAEYFFSKKTEFRAMIIVPTLRAHRYTQALKSPKYRADTPMILVPTLRVGMQFVTLRVTLNARLIPVPISAPNTDTTQDL
ncbi:hypothetical protein DND47_01620 [Pseudomonas syringae pv. syringae]|nr:hypothetical protein DND47_01620 [Pseudomonas syringae pv. syringae]